MIGRKFEDWYDRPRKLHAEIRFVGRTRGSARNFRPYFYAELGGVPFQDEMLAELYVKLAQAAKGTEPLEWSRVIVIRERSPGYEGGDWVSGCHFAIEFATGWVARNAEKALVWHMGLDAPGPKDFGHHVNVEGFASHVERNRGKIVLPFATEDWERSRSKVRVIAYEEPIYRWLLAAKDQLVAMRERFRELTVTGEFLELATRQTGFMALPARGGDE